MEYYVTQPKDYWIAPNAVNITLNAIGNANRIQGSVVSGAVIMCYVPSIKPASQGGEAENGDGLDYGVDHYPKRWPLSLSPTYFNSDSAKYVYAAIPRSASVGTQAVIVFPSELLDIYGRAERPEDSSDDSSSSGDDDVYYEQIGSTDYFYVFLQGIISSPSDSPLQRQMQHDILFGELDTPQGNENRQNEGFWFTYSSANGEVTFLKRIIMAATSWFTSLRLGNSGNVLSGVAKATTSAEYVNSETLVATPSYISANYLSKKNADTAQGRITFNAGLVSKQDVSADGDVISDNLHSDGYSDDTLAGSGYHVYKDANGNGHVCTDILDVRMKARFAELEIRKLSYINAEQVQSEAASKLEIVLPIAASGTVLNGTFSESNVAAYRCMVLADDGTMATKNGWKLGDQARCQTFNITAPGDYTNIESRLYWRLVVRIGQCMDDGTIITQQTDLTDYTGKIHHFFDLANLADLTCDPTTRTPNEGAEFAEFFSDTLTTGNAYHGMMTQNYNSASADDLAVMATQEWNDVPAADDDVVQMGSQTDETRMGFFVTKADGLNTGPYIYAGVNNFSLVGKMITKITPQEVLISARKLQVFSDPNAGDASPLTHYRGDWTQGSTSYYYDEWDYNGSRWLCLYQGAEGTTEAPGTTPANWKEISLKGDAGTGYKLLPNPNIIKTKQTGENTYDPATASLTCGYVKNVGGTITSVANATALIDNRYVIYFRRKSRGGDYESKYWFYTDSKARAFLSSLSLSGYDAVEFYLAENSLAQSLDIVTRATFLNSLSGIIDNIIVPVVADGSDGTDGTSPWTADNYNEMDSIACDANGKPVQINGSDQSVSTVLAVWHGSTEESFNVTSVKRNSTEVTLGSKTSGVTVTWDGTNKALTVTYDGAANTQAVINGKDEYEIAISANNGNFTPTLNFTVNGVRPGADGEPATIYRILPTVNNIAFARDNNGNLTPNSVSFYLECEKSQGGTIENPGIRYVGTVLYGTANAPTDADFNPSTAAGHHVAVWGNDLDGIVFNDTYKSIATVPNSFAYNQIYIALFKVVTENGSTSYILLDRETIHIVRDGAKGTDGKDGKDGETIKTVTVYKRSGTQPETPTGSTIPPTGWSTSVPVMCSGDFSDVTSGDYKGWRKATGDDNDGAFIKDTITFVTTSPNEVVRIAIKASSEEDYDFIFVGNLDANYASRPQDMDDISDSRKASGEESKIVSITVPTAGEHTLCVIYTKDGSSYDGMDCGWYKVINMENIVWSSMATFKNDILQGSWSTPVRWNGSDGDDGYSVTLTPSTIIINQSEELTTVGGVKDYYLDYTNATAILEVKKGGVPVDASITRSTDGTCSVPTITHQSTGRYLITMGAVNKHSGNTYVDPADGATRTRYYDKGRITINVTPNGASETTRLYLDFRCNLQGTINTIVKGDVETTVAEKITYGYNNETGSVGSLQAVGKYIRSSEKNIAQLTETVGSTNYGNNLFGFSKGVSYNGIRFVQGYGFVTNLGSNTQFGMARLGFNAQTGYYVVTCEAKMLSAARNITFAFWAYGDVLQTRSIGTNWTKLTMVFRIDSFPDAVDAKAGYFYSDGVYDGDGWTNPLTDSNRLAVRYLQIERGSVPSAFGICTEDAQSLLQEPITSEFVTASEGAIFYNDPNNDLNGLKHFRNRETYEAVPAYWQALDNLRYINICYGNGGSVYNVESGCVYTLSFWAKGSINGMSIHSYLYAASGQTPITDAIAGADADTDDNTGRINVDGDTETFLTTSWKKYYIHWYIDKATGPRTLIVARLEGDTTAAQYTRKWNNLNGVAFICGVRFDKGYVTSANRTVYETVMKQTARRMDFSVLVNSMEKAGIHLYTESNGTPDNEAELAKGIIELNADTTRVSNDLVVRRLLTDENKSKPHVEIFGSSALFFGNKGQANIVLSVDEDDCAQLNFFDNDGNFKYGLGPSTIFDNMAVRKDTWSQWFGLSLFSDYGNKYSAVRVHNLAAAQTASYFKFVEGSKQIGGAIIYNHSGNNSPSQYNDKVYSQQTLDTAYFIGIGYYLGEAIPQMSLVDLERGEQLYSRIVYQVEDAAGSAPKMIGAYWYRMTNGNPITARLTDTQGNLLNCSTSDNMSEYIQ